MIISSIAKLWRLIKQPSFFLIDALLPKARALLGGRPRLTGQNNLPIVRTLPTAVILVGKRHRTGMQTLSWVRRQFPDRFRNFIFVGVGKMDLRNHESHEQERRLRAIIEASLRRYTSYCHHHGLAAEYRVLFGANPMVEFTKFTQKAKEEYPRATSFAVEVIFWEVNSSQGGGPARQNGDV
jgi:hypothetical protein